MPFSFTFPPSVGPDKPRAGEKEVSSFDEDMPVGRRHALDDDLGDLDASMHGDYGAVRHHEEYFEDFSGHSFESFATSTDA